MRRSALALWAAVTALALTAGPAAAQSAGQQTVTDSTGTAQVGPTQVDAPVRVLSDGENASSGGSTGGEQTVSDSNGSAQVGSAGVNAPVRVASDGDNGAAGTSGSGETGTGALGEPLGPLDDGTGAQGGPVGLTGSLPSGGIGTPADAGGDDGGMLLAADFTADAAGSLPLTGLGVALLFAMGLLLLTGGGALRRGSVATG